MYVCCVYCAKSDIMKKQNNDFEFYFFVWLIVVAGCSIATECTCDDLWYFGGTDWLIVIPKESKSIGGIATAAV